MAGPNGSGKSTLTASLSIERQSNLVDPDQIARRMNPADPASAAPRGQNQGIRHERSLANAAEALLLANEGVVFDNSGLRRRPMLEIRNGQITWRAKRVSKWAADLERQISRAADLDG
ncbi:MAG: AAA family ATPase [Acidobacteriia bacterium]|nr:AAA family ATPase [Terriglobia bacterium]